MRMNAGTLDRVARIAIGSTVLIAALAIAGPTGLLLGIVALLLLGTGLAGWCPLYSVLGIDTCGLHLPHGGKTAMR